MAEPIVNGDVYMYSYIDYEIVDEDFKPTTTDENGKWKLINIDRMIVNNEYVIEVVNGKRMFSGIPNSSHLYLLFKYDFGDEIRYDFNVSVLSSLIYIHNTRYELSIQESTNCVRDYLSLSLEDSELYYINKNVISISKDELLSSVLKINAEVSYYLLELSDNCYDYIDFERPFPDTESDILSSQSKKIESIQNEMEIMGVVGFEEYVELIKVQMFSNCEDRVDYSSSDYTVNITLNDFHSNFDPFLRQIETTGSEFDFDNHQTSFDIEFPNDIDSTEINIQQPITTFEFTRNLVTIDGEYLTNKTFYFTQWGINDSIQVNITSTSEDGENMKEYNLNLYRKKHDDPLLQSLKFHYSIPEYDGMFIYEYYFRNDGGKFQSDIDGLPSGTKFSLAKMFKSKDMSNIIIPSSSELQNITNRSTNIYLKISGKISVIESGLYDFHIRSDDGISFKINGMYIFDALDQNHGQTSYNSQLTLNKNENYDIILEFQQGGGGAYLQAEMKYNTNTDYQPFEDFLVDETILVDDFLNTPPSNGQPENGVLSVNSFEHTINIPYKNSNHVSILFERSSPHFLYYGNANTEYSLGSYVFIDNYFKTFENSIEYFVQFNGVYEYDFSLISYSQDLQHSQEYIIHFRINSNDDAYLKNLDLPNGVKFYKDVFYYDLLFPSDQTSVNIAYTKPNESIITEYFTEGYIESLIAIPNDIHTTPFEIKFNSPYDINNIQTGYELNSIYIKVVAQNGNSNIYYITLSREKFNEDKIQNISFLSSNANISFSSNCYEYNLQIDNIYNSIILDVIPPHFGRVLYKNSLDDEYNENCIFSNIQSGDNYYFIKSIAHNEVNSVAYTFFIHKTLSTQYDFNSFYISNADYYNQTHDHIDLLGIEDTNCQFYVANYQSQIVIYIEPNISNGLFTIDGYIENCSLIFQSLFNLNFGSNQFEITQFSETLNSNILYFNIFRERLLKDVIISNNISSNVLWNNFQSNIFSFNLEFQFNSYDIHLDIDSFNSNSVLIELNNIIDDNSISLNCGNNVINIYDYGKITQEETIYNLNILRQSNEDTILSQFSIHNNSFYVDKDLYSFQDQINQQVPNQYFINHMNSYIDIDISPAEYGRVEIFLNDNFLNFPYENILLSFASNSIVIKSYAQNENFINTFQINIFQVKNKETQLSLFSIHENSFFNEHKSHFDSITDQVSSQYYVSYLNSYITIDIEPSLYGNVYVYLNNNLIDSYSSILLSYNENSILVESYAQDENCMNSFQIDFFLESNITNISILNDTHIIWNNFNEYIDEFDTSFVYQSYALTFDINAYYGDNVFVNENEYNVNDVHDLNINENNFNIKYITEYSQVISEFTFHINRELNTKSDVLNFELSGLDDFHLYNQSGNITVFSFDKSIQQFAYAGVFYNSFSIVIQGSSECDIIIQNNETIISQNSEFINDVYSLHFGDNHLVFKIISQNQENSQSCIINIYKDFGIGLNNPLNFILPNYNISTLEYNINVLYSSQSLFFYFDNNVYTDNISISHFQSIYNHNETITLQPFYNCVIIEQVAEYSNIMSSYEFVIFKNSDTTTDINTFQITPVYADDYIQQNCFFFSIDSQSITNWLYWISSDNNNRSNSILCGLDVKEVQISFGIPNRGRLKINDISYDWFDNSTNSVNINLNIGDNIITFSFFAENEDYMNSFSLVFHKDSSAIGIYSTHVANGNEIDFSQNVFQYSYMFSDNEENVYQIHINSNNNNIIVEITEDNNGGLTYDIETFTLIATHIDNTITFHVKYESSLIPNYFIIYYFLIDSTKSPDPQIPNIILNNGEVFDTNGESWNFHSTLFIYQSLFLPFQISNTTTMTIFKPLRGKIQYDNTLYSENDNSFHFTIDIPSNNIEIIGFSQDNNHSQKYVFEFLNKESTFDSFLPITNDYDFTPTLFTYSNCVQYSSSSIHFILNYDYQNTLLEIDIIQPIGYNDFSSINNVNNLEIHFDNLDENCPLQYNIIHFGKYSNSSTVYHFTYARLFNTFFTPSIEFTVVNHFWTQEGNSKHELTSTDTDIRYYIASDDTISMNISPAEKGQFNIYLNDILISQSNTETFQSNVDLLFQLNSITIVSYAQNVNCYKVFDYHIFKEEKIQTLSILDKNDFVIWDNFDNNINLFTDISFHYSSNYIKFNTSQIVEYKYNQSGSFSFQSTFNLIVAKQNFETSGNSYNIIEIKYVTQYSQYEIIYNLQIEKELSPEFQLQSLYFTLNDDNTQQYYIDNFDPSVYTYSLQSVDFEYETIQFFLTPSSFGSSTDITSFNLEFDVTNQLSLQVFAENETYNSQYIFFIYRNINQSTDILINISTLQVQNGFYKTYDDYLNGNNVQIVQNIFDSREVYVTNSIQELNLEYNVSLYSDLIITKDDIYPNQDSLKSYDVASLNLVDINQVSDINNSFTFQLITNQTTILTITSKSQSGTSDNTILLSLIRIPDKLPHLGNNTISNVSIPSTLLTNYDSIDSIKGYQTLTSDVQLPENVYISYFNSITIPYGFNDHISLIGYSEYNSFFKRTGMFYQNYTTEAGHSNTIISPPNDSDDLWTNNERIISNNNDPFKVLVNGETFGWVLNSIIFDKVLNLWDYEIVDSIDINNANFIQKWVSCYWVSKNESSGYNQNIHLSQHDNLFFFLSVHYQNQNYLLEVGQDNIDISTYYSQNDHSIINITYEILNAKSNIILTSIDVSHVNIVDYSDNQGMSFKWNVSPNESGNHRFLKPNPDSVDNLLDAGFHFNVKISKIKRFRSNDLFSSHSELDQEWILNQNEGFIENSEQYSYSNSILDSYNLLYNMFYKYEIFFSTVLYESEDSKFTNILYSYPSLITILLQNSSTDSLSFYWHHNSYSDNAKDISYNVKLIEFDTPSIYSYENFSSNSITINSLKHDTKYIFELNIFQIGDEYIVDDYYKNSVTVFTTEINSSVYPQINYKMTELFKLNEHNYYDVKSDLLFNVEYHPVMFIQNWQTEFIPTTINDNCILQNNCNYTFFSYNNDQITSWYKTYSYVSKNYIVINSLADNYNIDWKPDNTFSNVTLIENSDINVYWVLQSNMSNIDVYLFSQCFHSPDFYIHSQDIFETFQNTQIEDSFTFQYQLHSPLKLQVIDYFGSEHYLHSYVKSITNSFDVSTTISEFIDKTNIEFDVFFRFHSSNKSDLDEYEINAYLYLKNISNSNGTFFLKYNNLPLEYNPITLQQNSYFYNSISSVSLSNLWLSYSFDFNIIFQDYLHKPYIITDNGNETFSLDKYSFNCHNLDVHITFDFESEQDYNNLPFYIVFDLSHYESVLFQNNSFYGYNSTKSLYSKSYDYDSNGEVINGNHKINLYWYNSLYVPSDTFYHEKTQNIFNFEEQIHYSSFYFILNWETQTIGDSLNSIDADIFISHLEHYNYILLADGVTNENNVYKYYTTTTPDTTEVLLQNYQTTPIINNSIKIIILHKAHEDGIVSRYNIQFDPLNDVIFEQQNWNFSFDFNIEGFAYSKSINELPFYLSFDKDFSLYIKEHENNEFTFYGFNSRFSSSNRISNFNYNSNIQFIIFYNSNNQTYKYNSYFHFFNNFITMTYPNTFDFTYSLHNLNYGDPLNTTNLYLYNILPSEGYSDKLILVNSQAKKIHTAINDISFAVLEDVMENTINVTLLTKENTYATPQFSSYTIYPFEINQSEAIEVSWSLNFNLIDQSSINSLTYVFHVNNNYSHNAIYLTDSEYPDVDNYIFHSFFSHSVKFLTGDYLSFEKYDNHFISYQVISKNGIYSESTQFSNSFHPYRDCLLFSESSYSFSLFQINFFDVTDNNTSINELTLALIVNSQNFSKTIFFRDDIYYNLGFDKYLLGIKLNPNNIESNILTEDFYIEFDVFAKNSEMDIPHNFIERFNPIININDEIYNIKTTIDFEGSDGRYYNSFVSHIIIDVDRINNYFNVFIEHSHDYIFQYTEMLSNSISVLIDPNSFKNTIFNNNNSIFILEKGDQASFFKSYINTNFTIPESNHAPTGLNLNYDDIILYSNFNSIRLVTKSLYEYDRQYLISTGEEYSYILGTGINASTIQTTTLQSKRNTSNNDEFELSDTHATTNTHIYFQDKGVYECFQNSWSETFNIDITNLSSNSYTINYTTYPLYIQSIEYNIIFNHNITSLPSYIFISYDFNNYSSHFIHNCKFTDGISPNSFFSMNSHFSYQSININKVDQRIVKCMVLVGNIEYLPEILKFSFDPFNDIETGSVSISRILTIEQNVNSNIFENIHCQIYFSDIPDGVDDIHIYFKLSEENENLFRLFPLDTTYSFEYHSNILIDFIIFYNSNNQTYKYTLNDFNVFNNIVQFNIDNIHDLHWYIHNPIENNIHDFNSLQIYFNLKNEFSYTDSYHSLYVINSDFTFSIIDTDIQLFSNANNSIWFQNSLLSSDTQKYFIFIHQNSDYIYLSHSFHYLTDDRLYQETLPLDYFNSIENTSIQNQIFLNWGYNNISELGFITNFKLSIENLKYKNNTINPNDYHLYIDNSLENFIISGFPNSTYNHKYIDDDVTITYKIIAYNPTYLTLNSKTYIQSTFSPKFTNNIESPLIVHSFHHFNISWEQPQTTDSLLFYRNSLQYDITLSNSAGVEFFNDENNTDFSIDTSDYFHLLHGGKISYNISIFARLVKYNDNDNIENNEYTVFNSSVVTLTKYEANKYEFNQYSSQLDWIYSHTLNSIDIVNTHTNSNYFDLSQNIYKRINNNNFKWVFSFEGKDQWSFENMINELSYYIIYSNSIPIFINKDSNHIPIAGNVYIHDINDIQNNPTQIVFFSQSGIPFLLNYDFHTFFDNNSFINNIELTHATLKHKIIEYYNNFGIFVNSETFHNTTDLELSSWFTVYFDGMSEYESLPEQNLFSKSYTEITYEVPLTPSDEIQISQSLHIQQIDLNQGNNYIGLYVYPSDFSDFTFHSFLRPLRDLLLDSLGITVTMNWVHQSNDAIYTSTYKDDSYPLVESYRYNSTFYDFRQMSISEYIVQDGRHGGVIIIHCKNVINKTIEFYSNKISSIRYNYSNNNTFQIPSFYTWHGALEYDVNSMNLDSNILIKSKTSGDFKTVENAISTNESIYSNNIFGLKHDNSFDFQIINVIQYYDPITLTLYVNSGQFDLDLPYQLYNEYIYLDESLFEITNGSTLTIYSIPNNVIVYNQINSLFFENTLLTQSGAICFEIIQTKPSLINIPTPLHIPCNVLDQKIELQNKGGAFNSFEIYFDIFPVYVNNLLNSCEIIPKEPIFNLNCNCPFSIYLDNSANFGNSFQLQNIYITPLNVDTRISIQFTITNSNDYYIQYPERIPSIFTHSILDSFSSNYSLYDLYDFRRTNSYPFIFELPYYVEGIQVQFNSIHSLQYFEYVDNSILEFDVDQIHTLDTRVGTEHISAFSDYSLSIKRNKNEDTIPQIFYIENSLKVLGVNTIWDFHYHSQYTNLSFDENTEWFNDNSYDLKIVFQPPPFGYIEFENEKYYNYHSLIINVQNESFFPIYFYAQNSNVKHEYGLNISDNVLPSGFFINGIKNTSFVDYTYLHNFHSNYFLFSMNSIQSSTPTQTLTIEYSQSPSLEKIDITQSGKFVITNFIAPNGIGTQYIIYHTDTKNEETQIIITLERDLNDIFTPSEVIFHSVFDSLNYYDSLDFDIFHNSALYTNCSIIILQATPASYGYINDNLNIQTFNLDTSNNSIFSFTFKSQKEEEYTLDITLQSHIHPQLYIFEQTQYNWVNIEHTHDFEISTFEFILNSNISTKSVIYDNYDELRDYNGQSIMNHNFEAGLSVLTMKHIGYSSLIDEINISFTRSSNTQYGIDEFVIKRTNDLNFFDNDNNSYDEINSYNYSNSFFIDEIDEGGFNINIKANNFNSYGEGKIIVYFNDSIVANKVSSFSSLMYFNKGINEFIVHEIAQNESHSNMFIIHVEYIYTFSQINILHQDDILFSNFSESSFIYELNFDFQSYQIQFETTGTNCEHNRFEVNNIDKENINEINLNCFLNTIIIYNTTYYSQIENSWTFFIFRNSNINWEPYEFNVYLSGNPTFKYPLHQNQWNFIDNSNRFFLRPYDDPNSFNSELNSMIHFEFTPSSYGTIITDSIEYNIPGTYNCLFNVTQGNTFIYVDFYSQNGDIINKLFKIQFSAGIYIYNIFFFNDVILYDLYGEVDFGIDSLLWNRLEDQPYNSFHTISTLSNFQFAYQTHEDTPIVQESIQKGEVFSITLSESGDTQLFAFSIHNHTDPEYITINDNQYLWTELITFIHPFNLNSFSLTINSTISTKAPFQFHSESFSPVDIANNSIINYNLDSGIGTSYTISHIAYSTVSNIEIQLQRDLNFNPLPQDFSISTFYDFYSHSDSNIFVIDFINNFELQYTPLEFGKGSWYVDDVLQQNETKSISFQNNSMQKHMFVEFVAENAINSYSFDITIKRNSNTEYIPIYFSIQDTVYESYNNSIDNWEYKTDSNTNILFTDNSVMDLIIIPATLGTIAYDDSIYSTTTTIQLNLLENSIFNFNFIAQDNINSINYQLVIYKSQNLDFSLSSHFVNTNGLIFFLDSSYNNETVEITINSNISIHNFSLIDHNSLDNVNLTNNIISFNFNVLNVSGTLTLEDIKLTYSKEQYIISIQIKPPYPNINIDNQILSISNTDDIFYFYHSFQSTVFTININENHLYHLDQPISNCIIHNCMNYNCENCVLSFIVFEGQQNSYKHDYVFVRNESNSDHVVKSELFNYVIQSENYNIEYIKQNFFFIGPHGNFGYFTQSEQIQVLSTFNEDIFKNTIIFNFLSQDNTKSNEQTITFYKHSNLPHVLLNNNNINTFPTVFKSSSMNEGVNSNSIFISFFDYSQFPVQQYISLKVFPEGGDIFEEFIHNGSNCEFIFTYIDHTRFKLQFSQYIFPTNENSYQFLPFEISIQHSGDAFNFDTDKALEEITSFFDDTLSEVQESFSITLENDTILQDILETYIIPHLQQDGVSFNTTIIFNSSLDEEYVQTVMQDIFSIIDSIIDSGEIIDPSLLLSLLENINNITTPNGNDEIYNQIQSEITIESEILTSTQNTDLLLLQQDSETTLTSLNDNLQSDMEQALTIITVHSSTIWENMNQIDSNGDGIISENEVLTHCPNQIQQFYNADDNGDGFVTLSEAINNNNTNNTINNILDTMDTTVYEPPQDVDGDNQISFSEIVSDETTFQTFINTDTNNDQLLSYSEILSQTLTDIVTDTVESTLSTIQQQTHILSNPETVDINGDNQISEEEYITLNGTNEGFSGADLNNDGIVDQNEAENTAVTDTIISSVPIDSSNTIDQNTISSLLDTNTSHFLPQFTILSRFNLLDSNANNYISQSEFNEFHDSSELFDKIDTNGDGVIDFNEAIIYSVNQVSTNYSLPHWVNYIINGNNTVDTFISAGGDITLFNSIDLDGDGIISNTEAIKAAVITVYNQTIADNLDTAQIDVWKNVDFSEITEITSSDNLISQEYFNNADTNQDQIVSITEVYEVIHRLSIESIIHSLPTLWSKLIIFDNDSNSKISSSEFIQAGFSNDQFISIDQDGDGFISQAEALQFSISDSVSTFLSSAIKDQMLNDPSIWIQISNSYPIDQNTFITSFDGSSELFHSADKNGDGIITLSEAIEMTIETSVTTSVNQTISSIPSIWTSFTSIDSNNDNVISYEEFFQHHSNDIIQFIIADKNKDGIVTQDEIIQSVTPVNNDLVFIHIFQNILNTYFIQNTDIFPEDFITQINTELTIADVSIQYKTYNIQLILTEIANYESLYNEYINGNTYLAITEPLLNILNYINNVTQTNQNHDLYNNFITYFHNELSIDTSLSLINDLQITSEDLSTMESDMTAFYDSLNPEDGQNTPLYTLNIQIQNILNALFPDNSFQFEIDETIDSSLVHTICIEILYRLQTLENITQDKPYEFIIGEKNIIKLNIIYLLNNISKNTIVISLTELYTSNVDMNITLFSNDGIRTLL